MSGAGEERLWGRLNACYREIADLKRQLASAKRQTTRERKRADSTREGERERVQAAVRLWLGKWRVWEGAPTETSRVADRMAADFDRAFPKEEG